MSKDENNKAPESGRRLFLKQSFLAGVGVSAAGSLGAAQILEAPQGAALSPVAPAGGHNWEVAPAPIPESKITQTLETDVLVLGAGIAGMGTALGAAEVGLKVVVIEKMRTFSARGMHNGAIDSRVQKKAGIRIDRERVIAELVAFAGNRVHQNLVRLWAEKSGEIFDHFTDLAEARDMEVVLTDTFLVGRKFPDLYPGYTTAHTFVKKGAARSSGNEYVPTQEYFLGMMEAEAKAKGAQFLYSTPAQQLLREKGGRVVGVVAKSKGGFIRILARKGVVVATGSYTENPEMVNAWCPAAAVPEVKIYTPFGGNTGDGLRMAMWAGATMQAASPSRHDPHDPRHRHRPDGRQPELPAGQQVRPALRQRGSAQPDPLQRPHPCSRGRRPGRSSTPTTSGTSAPSRRASTALCWRIAPPWRHR